MVGFDARMGKLVPVQKHALINVEPARLARAHHGKQVQDGETVRIALNHGRLAMSSVHPASRTNGFCD
jgi:hypothetical protein